ncbi:MAG TPA: YdcF family protein [Burkholderiales bacterium]|nr:YdcF family protein [Burkholderiales bacterium]
MSPWELTNLVVGLVLPPGGLILLGILGVALIRQRARTGRNLALFALLSLYLLSMPIVANRLLQAIEEPYSDPTADRSAGAIVVLGGGSHARAPEYGDADTVSTATLERLRYAAHLHKLTGKPVLVTGGNPAGVRTTEAEQMRTTLNEFGVTTRWLEAGSNNTFENARLTYRTLKFAGIDSGYLVTHAWHMPRSKMAFEKSGMRVIPANLHYSGRQQLRTLDFVPSAGALKNSALFFHEIVGIVWYHLRFALTARTPESS